MECSQNCGSSGYGIGLYAHVLHMPVAINMAFLNKMAALGFTYGAVYKHFVDSISPVASPAPSPLECKMDDMQHMKLSEALQAVDIQSILNGSMCALHGSTFDLVLMGGGQR